ncbi:MAG: hypothetical protein ABI851_08900 [Saprospiraceae bacterium]
MNPLFLIKSKIAFSLIVFLTFCNGIIDKNSKIHQIIYVTYNNDPNSEARYSYNSSGDLIRQSMAGDTILYNYSSNKISKFHVNRKLNWLSRIDYTTDSTGRILHSLTFDENNKQISQFTFAYNKDGFLTETNEEIFSSGKHYINKFFYREGNLIEIKSYNDLGKLGSRYVYDYYSGKFNELNLFIQQFSDDIFPNERLGKQNKNLIKLSANISKEGDTLSLVKYQYASEGNKNLLIQTQTDVLNEFTTVIRYHFK